MKKNGIKLFEADSLDMLNDKITEFIEQTQYKFTDIKINIVELSYSKVYICSMFYMKNKSINKPEEEEDIHFNELKKHTDYDELSVKYKKAVDSDLEKIKAESKNKYETVLIYITRAFIDSKDIYDRYYATYRGKISNSTLRLMVQNQMHMNYNGIDDKNVHIDGDEFLKEYKGICDWLLMHFAKLDEEKKYK